MSEQDDTPDLEAVGWYEITDPDTGIVHRRKVTQEEAARYVHGEIGLGFMTGGGEPYVDERGRLVVEHERSVQPPDDPA